MFIMYWQQVTSETYLKITTYLWQSDTFCYPNAMVLQTFTSARASKLPKFDPTRVLKLSDDETRLFAATENYIYVFDATKAQNSC